MNIEPNGANIDAILAAQDEIQKTSRMTKVGRLFGATVAFATIGVGASAMIDGEPAAQPAEAAADCTPELGDVCDGQTIVYEDPIESVPPVTNVSGVTLPNKGTTTIPSTTIVVTTTTRPEVTTTTRPEVTTTTRPEVTTTTRPEVTTTTKPNQTTTTTTQPEATTTTKPNQTTTTTSTTSTTTTTTIPGTPSASVPTAD